MALKRPVRHACECPLWEVEPNADETFETVLNPSRPKADTPDEGLALSDNAYQAHLRLPLHASYPLW
jgi:hypothetical protein